jgi:hypothetical protein
LRFSSCEKNISSGITCPFGQLSLAQGYISDTLLTRPPLGLATPCDLHVLATPPAFRLSQDQTLQLNFLARIVPDALCRNPCCKQHGLLTMTDTFTIRVYPRNEFVHQSNQDNSIGCYCPLVGWTSGSVSIYIIEMQGSNNFWHPSSRKDGITQIK